MSMNLINVSRAFEVGSSIIEWDMKRAGLNLIKEYELLPNSIIIDLEKLPKKDCDIAIGKMQIHDKDFSKKLEIAFTEMMQKFLDVNQIDKDFDVISIKKDACFTINKKITVSEFGSYIRFVPKNEYYAYIYIKPYEFYFQRNGDIDIKGLTSDKKTRMQLMELHENGILNLLTYTVDLAESSGMNKKKMNHFLHSFVEMYKKKELDFDYYREFNIESRYRYQILGSETMADHIDASMLEKVNIEYNYKNIILPLINLIC